MSSNYVLTDDDLVKFFLEVQSAEKRLEAAKTKAATIKTEREKKKVEEKKQRALWEAEQQKPCNWIPKWYPMRKVYPQIWLEYLQTYNLTELINYAAELRDGKWRAEFPQDGGEHAFQLLDAQITQRINASTTMSQEKEALAKAQDKLKQVKAEFDEQRKDVCATYLETKKLMEEMYPASPAKAKAYTS